jgi:hypothetical protein
MNINNMRANRAATKTLLTNKKHDPIRPLGGANFFSEKPSKGKARDQQAGSMLEAVRPARPARPAAADSGARKTSQNTLSHSALPLRLERRSREQNY